MKWVHMNKVQTKIRYGDYLQLDRILNSQVPFSAIQGTESHHEMLFIIVHQVYELWFKQVLHELDSILSKMKESPVREKEMSKVNARLERMVEIFRLMIMQFQVLETMTPLDFLEFRNYLGSMSGFQSEQFHRFGQKMGLPSRQKAETSPEPTLFSCVEAWLERTPFLEHECYSFVDLYRSAYQAMVERERSYVEESEFLTASERELRRGQIETLEQSLELILSPEDHQQCCERGERRLSHRATLGALFLLLYHDHPVLHMPHRLLQNLIELDSQFTLWRNRHATMVLRMLGGKGGTGGSSGYAYLKSTVENHHLFRDLTQVSSFLVPRNSLPPLPEDLEKDLAFFYTEGL